MNKKDHLPIGTKVRMKQICVKEITAHPAWLRTG